MKVGKYIEMKRKEKKIERKALAYALSISYSKLQNIEKDYKTFDLSKEELCIISIELGLDKYEKEALNWHYKNSVTKNENTDILLLQNRKACEIMLAREDFSIYFDETIRNMIYDFFYEKLLFQEDGYKITVGDFSIIAWSILLDLPKLLDNCLYYAKSVVNINYSYSLKSSLIDILAVANQNSFKIFSEIFKFHKLKVTPDINTLKSIKSRANYYSPYSTVHKIISIKNNILNLETIDYINTPDYIRNIKNLYVYQLDHNFLFNTSKSPKKSNYFSIPDGSLIFVEKDVFPKFKEQLGIFIYKNNLIIRKYIQYENIYILKPYNNNSEEIILNSNKDNFNFIGRVLKFDALY